MTYAPINRRPERSSAAGATPQPVARRTRWVHARAQDAERGPHGENGPSGQALARALAPGRLHDIARLGLSGQPVKLPFADELQRAFGTSALRSVKAFVGGAASRANEQLGSSAFTLGDRVAFARPPDLWTAAHEATHVVQQRAGCRQRDRVVMEDSLQERQADAIADRVSRGESAAPLFDQRCGRGTAPADGGVGRRLQFYREQERDDGSTWRISDDMKLALRVEKNGEPNRHCYATADRIVNAGKILSGQRSAITLAASQRDTFRLSDNLLHRVIPTNKGPDGVTSGNDKASGMMLYPECGRAANIVMQGRGLRASGVYNKLSSPRFGAYEFLGEGGLTRPPSAQTRTATYGYDKDHGFKGALKSPEMILGDILIDSFGGNYFVATRTYQQLRGRGLPPGEQGFRERMNSQSEVTRGIDRQIGINRYAQPALGEAYVIVNDPLDEVPVDPDHLPYNYHWAAVILKSGGDAVTLENASNQYYDDWSYMMYGPPTKDRQTFHEQKSLTPAGNDTGKFGENPITIRVRPENARGGSTRWTSPLFSPPGRDE